MSGTYKDKKYPFIITVLLGIYYYSIFERNNYTQKIGETY